MNERDTGVPSDASVEKNKSVESIEQKQARVDEWIKNISENQEVKVVLGEKKEDGEMDSETLREVLESYGAKFKNLNGEGRESLKGYSEAERGTGVKQVWEKENIKDYKSWIKKYIVEYEETHPIMLPILGEKDGQPYPESGRKDSGMIQFLYELTSFASGETSPDDFKKYMEARVKNGVAWAEGRKKDRIKVEVPTSDKPILLGSIPREFPIAAMDWIKNCVKNKASEPLPQQ